MTPDKIKLTTVQYTRLLFCTVFIIVLALYLSTLAPGVVGGDAGEHQFAVPILGIPHTTGYPLYVLLGKLWTLILPFGSYAWRMNLFSALGGALAAGLTALTIYHLPPEKQSRYDWVGALLGGVILSFGLTLWQWSTIAGVRSFNIFFFALLTLQALLWANYRQAGEIQRAEKLLAWLAFTVGLSLAHHRTTVFYLPSLVGWIWWHDSALPRQPKRLLRLALLSLAPLSLYAFIYFRGINSPPYTHEPIYDLASFWFLVGSGDSSGLFLSIDPTFLSARLAFIWHDILAQLSLPGVILALVGAIFLARQRLPHFLLHLVLVLLLLWFTLDFEVVNLNEAPTWYLMPAYFIFAVWLGVGINGLLALGLQIFAGRTRSQADNLQSPISNLLPKMVALAATILLLALFTYTLAWPNWQQQYQTATRPLDEWRQLLRGTQGRRFVESAFPYVEPNAIILGDWEQYTPIKYAQLIEGQRPDIDIRNPLNLWPEKVAAAHAAGLPIYFARKPADLIGTPYLSMAGPLIHLQTAPDFAIPADLTVLNAQFEDQLELVGYRAAVIPQTAFGRRQDAPILQITLYWRVPQKVEWDYAFSFRLMTLAGAELYKQDASHAVLSSYPTSLWTPGEVVSDFYEFLLISPDEAVHLHILPYRTEGAGQWHNLGLNGADPPQEGIIIGPFQR